MLRFLYFFHLPAVAIFFAIVIIIIVVVVFVFQFAAAVEHTSFHPSFAITSSHRRICSAHRQFTSPNNLLASPKLTFHFTPTS